MDADRIIEAIVNWAKAQPTIQAVALVGSYARATARVDSDLDVVLLTTTPQVFRAETAWLRGAIGAPVRKWQDEDYGRLWSRRLWLEQNDAEIELGFATPSWADVNPLDPGTRTVISDGCRILHDPFKMLDRLCAAVAAVEQ
jgi:uncharacterized protein